MEYYKFTQYLVYVYKFIKRTVTCSVNLKDYESKK